MPNSDIYEIHVESTGTSFWQREQERAVHDLRKDAVFQYIKNKNKPYRIEMRRQEAKLVVDITDRWQQDTHTLILSFSPYRRLMSDYFLLIDSYEEVRKAGNLQKLEAIDMGRRGLHNEGAEKLIERLEQNVIMNHETARRFFTLMCALWHN